ncbi:MAG: hypothetical protein ACK53L_36260, partial [Pirellulaceae bacterium]
MTPHPPSNATPTAEADPLQSVLARIQALTNALPADPANEPPQIPSSTISHVATAERQGAPVDARSTPKAKTWTPPPHLKPTGNRDEPMIPLEPQSLSQAGISDSLLEE